MQKYIINKRLLLHFIRNANMRKLKNKELNRIEVEQFKTEDKTPLIVVLDNIRSLNNIGSVFRTSDSFLIEKIFLCGITATPPHKDIHKTALGATDSVTWEHVDETIDVVKKLQVEGVKVLAIEQVDESIKLQDFTIESNQKYAIVMGNEVYGVQQEVVDICDNTIEIPQYGTKHSLNISVTTGIVLWDLFKKMKY